MKNFQLPTFSDKRMGRLAQCAHVPEGTIRQHASSARKLPMMSGPAPPSSPASELQNQTRTKVRWSSWAKGRAKPSLDFLQAAAYSRPALQLARTAHNTHFMLTPQRTQCWRVVAQLALMDAARIKIWSLGVFFTWCSTAAWMLIDVPCFGPGLHLVEPIDCPSTSRRLLEAPACASTEVAAVAHTQIHIFFSLRFSLSGSLWNFGVERVNNQR